MEYNRLMIVHGLTKLTVVDYPSKVACIIFTGGCNFRCPYCHNGGLVLHPEQYPAIDEDEIFSFLSRRKGILDAVVISGGEPTLQKDLPDFVRRVKALGYLVKLDTNGSNPAMLKALIGENLLDYVAMDIKNSLDRYGSTIGIDKYDTGAVEKSMDFLMSGVVEYEFRTTVTAQTHDEESFRSIASRCSKCGNYFLQNFVQSENTIGDGFSPVDRKTLDTYIGILKTNIRNVQLRDAD